MKASKLIHVAVGVLLNEQGEVLVALRPQHAEQGNLWEFPGGKVEAAESVENALRRELLEEVGITVQDAKPLLLLEHEYPEKKVLLDVWQVEKFSGEPLACEGQAELRWVTAEELSTLAIPAANHPIVKTILTIDRQ